MPLNHLLADRQTNARAGIDCFGVQPLKDDEDTFGILGLDSDAVVLEGKDPLIAAYYRGNMDPRWLLSAVFDAVTDQILKDRNKLGGVCRESR